MVVYVLELANGHYYVGKTSRLDERLEEHRSGRGSAWTQRHRIVRLLETHQETSPFVEDMVTKQMMMKYGIAKVRGGSYCEVFLPRPKYNAVLNEIRGAAGLCFRCGGPHYIKDCVIGQNGKQHPEDRTDPDAKDTTADHYSSFDDDDVKFVYNATSRFAASAVRKVNRVVKYFWG